MYTVINKTRGTTDRITGDFPNLDYKLNHGEKIIVISSHSHTIKVPYSYVENGITYWEWDDYPYDLIAKPE